MPARVERTIAAFHEAARMELLGECRHRAGDGGQRRPALVRIGQCLQQQARVGMAWRGKELLGRGHFDDLAGVHERDVVGHAGHDAEIMGDEQQPQPALALQVQQQVEDLFLDRHVECRGGLIRDEELRLGRQCDGDHHPLLLPAREAERILVDAPFGLGDADTAQPVNGLDSRSRAAQQRVRFDRFDDLLTHAHHRVQARGRFLEDHGHTPTAHSAHARFGQCERVLAVEFDTTGGDAPAFRQQPHQRQRRHALAAARFADQRKGLAAVDGQAQRVDGPDEPAVAVKLDGQILDVQHAGSVQ
jgi:hypothetical protein